jgi:hypothetical protein
MAIEMAGWRLQDVRRWDAPRGDAPPVILQEQCGLGLSAGEAELAGVMRQPPCRVIVPQRLQTLGNIGSVKPFDVVFRAISYGVQTIGRHELNGACTILADMGDQRKNIACGNLELRSPAREHLLVVRQEAP